METLTSVDGFDALLGSGKPVVLQFFAAWDSKSEQITAVLDTLRGSHDHLSFARADAEEVHALAARFDIVAVPTVLVVGNDGKAQARVDGADALAISRMVMGVEAGGSGGGQGAGVDAIAPAAANTAAANSTAAKKSSNPEAELAAVHGRCKALVESDKVYLFMKGSPAAPECGFSRQAVALMAKYDLTYSTFDVLSDPEIRAGIKTFGNWPTFPQLYINAKLVGGLDVIKELDEEGEFLAMVPESHGGHLLAEEELNARIAALINSAPVMLFMKGGRWKPYCKFSKRAVALLHSAGVTKFGTFNIFDDEEVRQGIKTYSNWPTFPQLYIRGKLIGGLDVVKELHEEGELLPMLEGIEVATAETDLDARIYDILRTGDIVLVMKGSLAEPKCKFSRAMVEALAEHGVTNVATFDILEDGDVRERIKAFSNWPTFPQLYIKAKLVGGLDVVKELIEDDGLLPMLEGIEYGAAGPSA